MRGRERKLCGFDYGWGSPERLSSIWFEEMGSGSVRCADGYRVLLHLDGIMKSHDDDAAGWGGWVNY